ncbi:MAG: pyridoxal-phosphate dependent enzyme [Patescibacteria group bacterium]
MIETHRNVFSGATAIKDFLNPDNNPYIPLVEIPAHLNPFTKDKVRIFAKLMNMVPLMNVKSLPAFNMLLEAEEKGKLKGVKALIENSSGNTVFSLATIGRLFGIPKTKAIVSHEVTWGKLQLLRLFGTEIMVNEEPICPDPADKNSGIYQAKRIGLHKGWFNPGQYENEANPRAHEKWTGHQIWEQTEGKVTVFCGGLGTTGTMVGAGGYLKKQNSKIVSVGVARLPNNSVPGVRTPNLLHEIAFDWKSVTDHIEEVGTKESFVKSLELCRAGLVVGPSSGFAFEGLLRFLSKQQASGDLESLHNEEGEVMAVFICPDSPLPYLEEYFEYLDASHFPKIENENLLINKPDGKRVKKSITPDKESEGFDIEPEKAYELIYGISQKEMWQKLQEGERISKNPEVILIDIRSYGEFVHFHLPVSERMDSYKISENMPQLVRKWKKQKVFLLCPMGVRTRMIASMFRKKGVTAYSIKGGATEWSAKNLPRWRPDICKA